MVQELDLQRIKRLLGEKPHKKNLAEAEKILKEIKEFVKKNDLIEQQKQQKILILPISIKKNKDIQKKIDALEEIICQFNTTYLFFDNNQVPQIPDTYSLDESQKICMEYISQYKKMIKSTTSASKKNLYLKQIDRSLNICCMMEIAKSGHIYGILNAYNFMEEADFNIQQQNLIIVPKEDKNALCNVLEEENLQYEELDMNSALSKIQPVMTIIEDTEVEKIYNKKNTVSMAQ